MACSAPDFSDHIRLSVFQSFMSFNKLRTTLNLPSEITQSCTHIHVLDSQSQHEFQTQVFDLDVLSNGLPFALVPLNFNSALLPIMPHKTE